MKYWEIIPDKLSSGWTWGCVLGVNSREWTCDLLDSACHGPLLLPPWKPGKFGGWRGPKASISYRDVGEADCPIRAAGWLGGVPWFDAGGVWHAAKTANVAYTKWLLRRLSIGATTKLIQGYGRRKWSSCTLAKIGTGRARELLGTNRWQSQQSRLDGGAASQPCILAGRQSSLLTHIATVNASLCVPMKR